jgi:uracil-DNA glycosylase family 4
VSDPEFPDPDERNVLVPGCARCPALLAHREHVAWGNGPADAAVMVVGEAPAAGELGAETWQGGNHTGLAYTSRHSGRRVRELFENLGVEAYYTNAVKCYPAAPDDPTTNREPTDAERRRCSAHLRAEVDQVDPDVVVATGRHATEAVLHAEDRQLDGFLDAVLEPMDCETLDVRLLPILHPSYQDVWLARLGYEPAGYRSAIAERLP